MANSGGWTSLSTIRPTEQSWRFLPVEPDMGVRDLPRSFAMRLRARRSWWEEARFVTSTISGVGAIAGWFIRGAVHFLAPSRAGCSDAVLGVGLGFGRSSCTGLLHSTEVLRVGLSRPSQEILSAIGLAHRWKLDLVVSSRGLWDRSQWSSQTPLQ